MRSLIKLALFLVVGILVYNYFFGTVEEKQQSREIFSKVRDLGKEAWGLLRSEKDKFDDGKYDEAVDQVGGLYQKLRRSAQEVQDSKALERISELERKRRSLESQLENSDENTRTSAEQADIRRQWTELMRETEDLMGDMEKGQ